MGDNVWFTYKARIQAHKRLEWLDFHSQMLLVWYAILSATLAVLTVRYPQVLGPDTDVLATILSIALLGVSLAVANRDFRGRAMLMRENYLKLQKLYRDISRSNHYADEHEARYEGLLVDAENHRDIDDRVARTFAQNLTSRQPNWLDYLHAYGWLFMRAVITLLLYVAPLVAGFYAWSVR